MKTRFVAGVALVLMALMLAGCGGAGSKTKPAVEKLPNSGQTPTKTTTGTGDAHRSEALFVVARLDGNKTTASQLASEPVLSPDKKKAAYIDPVEFELIGDILVIDQDTGRVAKMTLDQKALPQYSPKKVSWYDNTHLLAVVGFAYGTVTIGGDLYLIDVANGGSQLLYKGGDNEEVTDARVRGDKISLQIAKFNQNKTAHQAISKDIPRP